MGAERRQMLKVQVQARGFTIGALAIREGFEGVVFV